MRDFAGVKIILTIALLQLLTGCVKVDLTGKPKTTASSTPTTTLPTFQVTAVTPATTADGLTPITVTFSNEVKQASVTATSFAVTLDDDATSTDITLDGTFSHNASTRTVTFTPTPLAREYSYKSYSIKVSLTNQVKNAADKALTPYNGAYTVAPKWDAPAPIDTEAASVSGQPLVTAEDSQGNITVAWLQDRYLKKLPRKYTPAVLIFLNLLIPEKY